MQTGASVYLGKVTRPVVAPRPFYSPATIGLRATLEEVAIKRKQSQKPKGSRNDLKQGRKREKEIICYLKQFLLKSLYSAEMSRKLTFWNKPTRLVKDMDLLIKILSNDCN